MNATIGHGRDPFRLLGLMAEGEKHGKSFFSNRKKKLLIDVDKKVEEKPTLKKRCVKNLCYIFRKTFS